MTQAKKAVLLVAAESIALSSGMAETVADVVQARAFKHYGEGLRQYLAIRLRSQPRAERALITLRDQLQHLPAGSLLAPPGPRAQLYRMARALYVEQANARRNAELPNDAPRVITTPRTDAEHASVDARESAHGAGEALAWRAPAEPLPAAYLSALQRLREELAPEEAELLELHYARELSLAELAHVLGRASDELERALSDAREHALSLVGKAPPSRLGGVEGALQEAFALEPTADALERGRAALPPGTIIAERYQVQERVGDGSFGDVYRALDTDVPGHVVALKLLHRPSPSEEARKSALRELRLIASVFHPSVVDFKDHGWYDDRLWFVMPWYEGETLEERIQRKPLSRSEAQEIFTALAQALATMHAAGIRHQDVKPDNIFLARIGEVGKGERTLPVLLDLGVAAKDAEMIVAGTPLYFPPEIAAQYAGRSGKPKVTGKADVFSLALSLRNALEPETQEQVPGTAIESFIAHRAECPPLGPSGRAFAFLEPFFARWLARDPELRPSAEELAEELAVLTRPEQERARRRATMRWAAPIALGSLLGLSSITYVYLREREEAHEQRLRADVTMSKLDAESARRAHLEESYQHSELTRQQLSERLLARTREANQLDAQLSRARRDYAELGGRLQAVSSELEATRRERENTLRRVETQQARISVVEGQLFDAEQKRAFVESELRESRSRARSAESELDELRARARSLLAELERARDDTDAQLERATTLEQTVRNLRQEKLRVELELEMAQKRAGAFEERPIPAPAPAPADS